MTDDPMHAVIALCGTFALVIVARAAQVAEEPVLFMLSLFAGVGLFVFATFVFERATR